MSRWDEPASERQRAYILRMLTAAAADVPSDVVDQFRTAQARGLTKRDARDLIPLLQSLTGAVPDGESLTPPPRRDRPLSPADLGTSDVPTTAVSPDLWAEEYPGQAEKLYPRWYLERRGYFDRS